MLHGQSEHNSWASHKRALFISPLSAFPIALAFGIMRDSTIDDFKSVQDFFGLALFPAIAALYITIEYYLFEVAVFWIALRYAPKLLSSLAKAVLVGLISAEGFLWIQFYPYSQLDDKNVSYFSALFAVCGLTTGLIFHRLSHRVSPS